MVWVWVLTSPYWDCPLYSSNVAVLYDSWWSWFQYGFKQVHIEIPPSGVAAVPNGHGLVMDLNKSILRSPIWSCCAKIPGGHGFHMDSNKSIWRFTHLALQQCFLADMVEIWILTSPCGDSPVQSLLPSWWTCFAYEPSLALCYLCL